MTCSGVQCHSSCYYLVPVSIWLAFLTPNLFFLAAGCGNSHGLIRKYGLMCCTDFIMVYSAIVNHEQSWTMLLFGWITLPAAFPTAWYLSDHRFLMALVVPLFLAPWFSVSIFWFLFDCWISMYWFTWQRTIYILKWSVVFKFTCLVSSKKDECNN